MIVGIDLGTTNSLVAVFTEEGPVSIPNRLGKHLTPSVVSVDENGNVYVGETAQERRNLYPDSVAQAFKRSMGTDRTYDLSGKKFRPEELSSMILRYLKEDAEAYLGEPVTEAVISVPAYFDDNCRTATKLAAKLSGIYVERLVNEPSAAALAYQARHGFGDGTYMIVDFGGGTLDISIVDSFDSVMEILAVAGDNHLGGKDFNEAIAYYFCKENGIDMNTLSPDDKAIVYRLAEECKISLTTQPMAMMIANIGSKQLSLTLDNNKLIEVCSAVFERVASPVRKALHDSRLSIDDIDDIILVGGSCKMPTVRAFIEKITGKRPCTDIDPDTAIAQGAGIFAGIKDRNDKLKDIILTDICPFSLGTDVLDIQSRESVMDFIIDRNSPLPTSREHIYSAVNDGQTVSKFKFYQGESRVPSRNIYIGELCVKHPPARKHQPTCTARMTYDINGILVVDVTTLADNKHYSHVMLSSSNNMSDEEINTALKKMETLKISPADKEENRLLIARAERFYEEALTEESYMIDYALGSITAALNMQNNRRIHEAAEDLAALLDNLEY